MALENKKLITIINSFVVSTSEFLNKFCAEAHAKLSNVHRNVERLEVLIELLEYKLKNFP